MRKASAFAALLLLLGVLALGQQPRAQLTATGVGGGGFGGGFTGTCAQSTAFLARASGLDIIHQQRYDALICGLVTDGVWATGDLFYVYTTNSSGNALLNLISSSFTGTVNGTMTFTADSDYAGDGTTGYIDTSYVFGSGNWSTNSATLLAYVINSRTGTTNSYCAVGQGNTAVNSPSYIAPNNGASGFTSDVNGGAPAAAGQTNAQGQWVAIRSGATTTAAYKNGNTTAIGTDASAALNNATTLSFLSHACRFGTTGAPSNFSADRIAAIWIGGVLTPTQMANLSTTRINTYMTAYGKNVY